jgi:hypothetical protein
MQYDAEKFELLEEQLHAAQALVERQAERVAVYSALIRPRIP